LLQPSHCNDKFFAFAILSFTLASTLAYSQFNNLFDTVNLEGILKAGRILLKNCIQSSFSAKSNGAPELYKALAYNSSNLS
jgi:hypothetical protein